MDLKTKFIEYGVTGVLFVFLQYMIYNLALISLTHENLSERLIEYVTNLNLTFAFLGQESASGLIGVLAVVIVFVIGLLIEIVT